MNKEDRFLDKIVETLKSYEVAYRPGAWEEFAYENRRRKKVILWQRMAVGVAVLFLIFSAAVRYFYSGDPVKEPLSVKILKPNATITGSSHDRPQNTLNEGRHTQSAKQEPSHPQGAEPSTVQQHDVSPQDGNVPFFAREKINASPTVENASAQTDAHDLPVETDTVVTAPSLPAIADRQSLRAGIKTETKHDISQVLQNSAEPVQASKGKKIQKDISYALVLSPAIADQKFTLGSGGFEISYRLSPNVSLNGGLMYASIHGGKDLNDLSQGSRKLQNVSLAVSGLELPVGVQYQTKGGFFLTAGLSGMTVISQKADYTYLSQVTETVTVVSGGLPQEIVRIVSQETTEQNRQRSSGYIGFYMFSGGTKVRLGDQNITLGPFVRVPFSRVSSDQINLVQGGLRINWTF